MTTGGERKRRKRKERKGKGRKSRRQGPGIRPTSVVFIDASRPPMFLSEAAPRSVLLYLIKPGPSAFLPSDARGRAKPGREQHKSGVFWGEESWQKKGRGTRRATVLTALLMHSYPCLATTCWLFPQNATNPLVYPCPGRFFGGWPRWTR